MLQLRGLRCRNHGRRLGDASTGLAREEAPHQRHAKPQQRNRRRGQQRDPLSAPPRRGRGFGLAGFVAGRVAGGIGRGAPFPVVADTRVGRRCDPAHRRQQSVTALGDGLQITRRAAVVAEGLAQLRDRLRHDVVAGQRARPHPFEDRDPAHHLALVRHEHEQDLHRLHRDPPRTRHAGFVDVAARDVDDAIADLQEVGFGLDEVFMLVQHSASMPSAVAIVLVNTLPERRSSAPGKFGKVPACC